MADSELATIEDRNPRINGSLQLAIEYSKLRKPDKVKELFEVAKNYVTMRSQSELARAATNPSINKESRMSGYNIRIAQAMIAAGEDESALRLAPQLQWIVEASKGRFAEAVDALRNPPSTTQRTLIGQDDYREIAMQGASAGFTTELQKWVETIEDPKNRCQAYYGAAEGLYRAK
jgi:hypothetical protein